MEARELMLQAQTLLRAARGAAIARNLLALAIRALPSAPVPSIPAPSPPRAPSRPVYTGPIGPHKSPIWRTAAAVGVEPGGTLDKDVYGATWWYGVPPTPGGLDVLAEMGVFAGHGAYSAAIEAVIEGSSGASIALRVLVQDAADGTEYKSVWLDQRTIQAGMLSLDYQSAAQGIQIDTGGTGRPVLISVGARIQASSGQPVRVRFRRGPTLDIVS